MHRTVPLMTVVGVFITSDVMTALLAQSAGLVDPGMGSLIGNLGVMGVLIWHMWYHTTKTYPGMLDKFGAELDKIRETFAREQSAARVEHDRETNELRNMLYQNMQAMRTAVHDVKDTANTAITKVASGAPPIRWEVRREPEKQAGEPTP